MRLSPKITTLISFYAACVLHTTHSLGRFDGRAPGSITLTELFRIILAEESSLKAKDTRTDSTHGSVSKSNTRGYKKTNGKKENDNDNNSNKKTTFHCKIRGEGKHSDARCYGQGYVRSVKHNGGQ